MNIVAPPSLASPCSPFSHTLTHMASVLSFCASLDHGLDGDGSVHGVVDGVRSTITLQMIVAIMMEIITLNLPTNSIDRIDRTDRTDIAPHRCVPVAL